MFINSLIILFPYEGLTIMQFLLALILLDK